MAASGKAIMSVAGLASTKLAINPNELFRVK